MRLLALADIDDLRWRGGTGAADTLLSCGDVADSVILEAADAYGCGCILAVKGNHDRATPFPPPILDLHLRTHSIGGVTFGGFNGSWKYKPRGHFLYEQGEAGLLLASMPPVDVLLAHNSPRGIHDREDSVHVGFDALNTYIQTAKPRLLVHGHQHAVAETKVGQTRVIGVYGHTVVEV